MATTEEIISDLKSKPQVPIKGNTSDFLKKFSQQQTDDGKPSATNVGDPNLGIPKYNEEEPPEESIGVTESEITSDRTGKKKGFVERQIEENRKLKEELDNVKKNEIPKFETKIQELERFVEDSKSTAEANHYQKQLNDANEQKSQLESQLTQQITDLRNKLDFHDLSSNPDFQKTYVEPMREHFLDAKSIIDNEGDANISTVFNRAVLANQAVFAATSDEQRISAIQERREALREITNSLDDYDKAKFIDAIKNFEKATERHNVALSDYQKTKEEITRTAKQKEVEARSNFIKQWRNSFEEQESFVKKEAYIPEDVYSYMTEKGIKYDTSKDEAVALAATQQSEEQASVDDMNRLINQGKLFKKQQAYIKALQEMVKEKDGYISALKGSSKVNSSSNASDSQKARVTVSEGLAAKIARFSPQNRVNA